MGRRNRGMTEAARQGGSKTRGVKERLSEQEERGVGRQAGRWYRESQARKLKGGDGEMDIL